jgi:hypothetical protein
MEIINCEQGSDEWKRARLGIPTASEYDAILAKGQGKTRRTYMMKLLGERLTGEPAESYTNANMERGKTMEAEARNAYAFMQAKTPELVGFVRNGNTGCSPDSFVDADGALELKTKLPHLQLEAWFAKVLPPEHKAQCQGILMVTDRDWIDFCSYWAKLPLLVVRVQRDPIYITMLRGEVNRFCDELDALEAQAKSGY